MRRLTAKEAETALAFKLTHWRSGCQVHENRSLCEGNVQAAHLIPKQALRRRGLHEYVWDPRNGIGACERAHRRSDSGLERFPVEVIPESAWEFARELGLEWYLEKLYGERRAA